MATGRCNEVSFGILHGLLDKINKKLSEYIWHTHYTSNIHTLKLSIGCTRFLEVSQRWKLMISCLWNRAVWKVM